MTTMMMTTTKKTRLAGAVFSEDERYRFQLWRETTRGPHPWSHRILFIMLNPSTATHQVLDPTVTRCWMRAQREGFTRMDVVNLWALRATDPQELYKQHGDPLAVLKFNNATIFRLAAKVGKIICGWGAHGVYANRGWLLANALARKRYDLRCYGTTNAGQPRHPLYIAYAVKDQPFLVGVYAR